MTLSSLLGELDIFKATTTDGKIEITVPVALRTTHTFLVLLITTDGDGFTVCDDGTLLDSWGDRGYSAYVKEGRKCYCIEHNSELFYKSYPADYSPLMAISNFVKFFAAFDDFAADYMDDVLIDEDDWDDGNGDGCSDGDGE